MKIPLSSKRKNVAVILGSKQFPLSSSQTKEWYYERLRAWCDEHCSSYSFIMHDRDEENGSPKWLHIHMCLIMRSVGKGRNYPSLLTILNALSKVVVINNTLGIQIDEMTSEVGSIQYLIHKRNKDKAQYKEDEVITSYPQEELHTLMESEEEGCLSITYLVSVCKSCSSRIEIMQEIGLKAYKEFRLVIGDILTDLRATKWRNLICDGVVHNACRH